MSEKRSERAEELTRQLEEIEVRLRAFADEVWHGIDFRDLRAREARIRDLDQFASLVERYQTLAADVATSIRRLAAPAPVPTPPPGLTVRALPVLATPTTTTAAVSDAKPHTDGHRLGENFRRHPCQVPAFPRARTMNGNDERRGEQD